MRKERFRIRKHVHSKLYAIFIPSNPSFVHSFIRIYPFNDWSKLEDFREYQSYKILSDRNNIYIWIWLQLSLYKHIKKNNCMKIVFN